MNNNIEPNLLTSIEPERIANMHDFQPIGEQTNTILFANFNFEGENLMPTNKQKIIDATLAIINHNKNALAIIEEFAEKEERYIEQCDREIHEKIIKEFDGIRIENNMYSIKTREAIKYKNEKVQGKDMVTIRDLQEGLNEMIRLQSEINIYLPTAKKYSTVKK